MSYIDNDFAGTFGLKVLKGRFFSKEYQNDTYRSYVVNRTLAEAMGIEDPIGRTLKNGPTEGTIIGVVEDFHIESLHREIRPHMLILSENKILKRLYIRVEPVNLAGTLGIIQEIIEKFSPGYPFEYHFLNEEIDRFYRNDRLTQKLITSLMVIAVLIACLGLFGLIAFSAQRRTKEIGIRKILGSSVFGVVRLIAKEYTLLVIIANLAAWPIAYYAVTKWLEGFAYRPPITPWIFAAAGGLSILLSVLAGAYQSFKAGLADPVDSLRSE